MSCGGITIQGVRALSEGLKSGKLQKLTLIDSEKQANKSALSDASITQHSESQLIVKGADVYYGLQS